MEGLAKFIGYAILLALMLVGALTILSSIGCGHSATIQERVAARDAAYTPATCKMKILNWGESTEFRKVCISDKGQEFVSWPGDESCMKLEDQLTGKVWEKCRNEKYMTVSQAETVIDCDPVRAYQGSIEMFECKKSANDGMK